MKKKKAENKIDSIDLAKFIFAFSVIYIHAGGHSHTANPIKGGRRI